MGHTSSGKDLTLKLASKLETGLVSDAVEIEADGDQAVFTRPIDSGKAFEKKVVTSGTVFATIHPNNIPMLEKDDSRSGDIEAKDIDITDMRTVIKDVIRKASEGVDLSEANVIIAGGRGGKSEEGVKLLDGHANLVDCGV